MKTIVPLIAAAVVTTGCVAGQSLSYDYKPAPVAARSSGVVAVAVSDERPYVKSGEKKPDYVGHYRGGFGNTWDVTTKGEKPLADIITGDLRDEMAALGFSAGSSGRKLNVTIRDWDMDTYMNGKFWYDLMVSVIGDDGHTVLAETALKEEKRIEGSVWTGAKSAVEDEMPKLYGEVVMAIARNNPAVLEALGKK